MSLDAVTRALARRAYRLGQHDAAREVKARIGLAMTVDAAALRALLDRYGPPGADRRTLELVPSDGPGTAPRMVELERPLVDVCLVELSEDEYKWMLERSADLEDYRERRRG